MLFRSSWLLSVCLLRGDIPIIASSISVAILKAMRDTTLSSIGSEISYYSEKSQLDDCGGLVLESIKGGSYTARDMYLCTEPTAELREFASHRPVGESTRSKNITAAALEHHDHLNLPFTVEPHPVDHSILGAVAYILRGDTTIAYTGDYRLHGAGAENTRRFISPRALTNKPRAHCYLLLIANIPRGCCVTTIEAVMSIKPI